MFIGHLPYIYFHDPSHGWLEVPEAVVIELKCDISPWSYKDCATKLVYLEEDCDMAEFMLKAMEAGRIIEMTDKYIDPIKGQWNIRNLPRYRKI